MSDNSLRPAKVSTVLPNSLAAEIGFEPGDAIVRINGQAPRDLIDYQFLCADDYLELDVLDRQGALHELSVEKAPDEDLGLGFETAVFDGLMQCNNRCPFCFIDQQPPGKRESLYLKDDDYRLSFLYGSYLTLTNLSPKEWQRIEQMRLSPLYVSVHATEAPVRIRLLKNNRAGQILEQLAWFQARRLQIHAQVVVCPGINDGDHLQQTLLDLAQFHQGDIPAVISVAVVPVGLTRFRPSQDELIPVTQAKAQEVIDQVQALQNQFKRTTGSHVAWLADEWFLIARQALPPASHYEDYPQIGNGVGSIRQFIKDFQQTAQSMLPPAIANERKLTWVVGNAVEHAFGDLVAQLNQVQGLTVSLAALNSDYWGQEITVTGLLTGQDLIAKLAGRELGDGILLPALMLKHDDTCFLDDWRVEDVVQQLGVPIYVVADVASLIQCCVT
jgi:putative radical SAM enzyme (TIGR03279 family)